MGWCDSTGRSELWWVGGGRCGTVKSVKKQIQLVCPLLVSRFRAPPAVLCVARNGFQASSDLSGVVPLEALLQLPPVTVFTSPYPLFWLFLHPYQLLLVPRFENFIIFMKQGF